MGYIYLVTNKVNNKQYIGQSICKDIKTRWKQHRVKDTKSIGNYLLSAYNKYGIDNFTYKIVCICFDEDCNKFEEEYIKKFNTLAPNGYNLQSGGKRIYVKKDKLKLSEEQLQKMRDRMLGIKLSDKTKKKIADASRGKIITQNTRDKISKSMTGKKRGPMSKETKEKCLKFLICSEKNKKKVGKYDINNILIESYSSITEASIKNNIQRMTLSNICNNKTAYNSVHNYIFKFI